MKYKNHILFISLFMLIVLSASASVYRTVVLKDYIVSYEGECDPYTESCFYDCEDEECTEYYYFTKIERMAYEIHALCGPDVTECDAAYECQENVQFCEISYCEPQINDTNSCEELTEEDFILTQEALENFFEPGGTVEVGEDLVNTNSEDI